MNDMHVTPEQLVDYLHHELAPAEDAAIHAHLALCSACAQARDAEVSLTELLRAHAEAEERDLPAGVVASVRAAITHRPITALERLSAFLRPAIALPAAAAIALLLYAGVHLWHVATVPATIDAAYYVDSHAALGAITPLSEDAPMPPTFASDDAAR